jgi:hypothetical protein
LNDTKLKVFGIGLSRTGTKTLGHALKMLGYSNHAWDPVLHERWFAGDLEPLFAMTDAVDCVEDWPFLAIYRQLMDRYGDDARYVLTLRKDPEIWVESVIAHAKFQAPHAGPYRRMAFGYDDPENYRAEYIAYYERHNDGVRAAVVEYGLEHRFIEVCWEKGDGWNELCGLIGRSPPAVPFPHLNHRPTG